MSLKNQVVGLCLNSGDTNTSKGLKVDENSKYIITLVDSQMLIDQFSLMNCLFISFFIFLLGYLFLIDLVFFFILAILCLYVL